MTPAGARRLFVVAAFAFLGSVYAFAQWRDLSRGPHVDELEHLHAAVLMARGERVYVDFAEHHPPLFWATLRVLVPDGENLAAMQSYVVRARLLSGVVTAIAILAAALILWRATGNSWTVLTFIGLVFGARSVWRNGLGDIRPDSTALALWWTGAALVLLARRPTLRGLGLGCVFLAAMVKPQWPLSSLVIGIVFLVDAARERRALMHSSAVALLVAAAGLGVTACLADLRMVYFHVFTLTSAMVAQVFPPGTIFPPLFGCPPLLRPTAILAAAVVVIAVWFRRRAVFRMPRLVVILLLIVAASMAEIFFIYPYPAVDSRFYSFWTLAASSLLVLLPLSASGLLPAGPRLAERLRSAIPVGAMLLALVASLDLIQPERPRPDSYWRSAAWIDARLAPGETVWNGWTRHPIAARDASYYWFGMLEVIPVALKLATTEPGRSFLPALTEEDLPPCRIERGLDSRVRFLAEPLDTLPLAKACFARLREKGALAPTPYNRLWLVRR